MYFCNKRRVWISSLGQHVDSVDAAIFVAPDGRQTMKTIEVLPYIFNITDDGYTQKTVVKKMIPIDAAWKKMMLPNGERRVVLTLPVAMNMPWDNKAKVLEKMRLYLLFS
jgi:hypothetical protein